MNVDLVTFASFEINNQQLSTKSNCFVFLFYAFTERHIVETYKLYRFGALKTLFVEFH